MVVQWVDSNTVRPVSVSVPGRENCVLEIRALVCGRSGRSGANSIIVCLQRQADRKQAPVSHLRQIKVVGFRSHVIYAHCLFCCLTNFPYGRHIPVSIAVNPLDYHFVSKDMTSLKWRNFEAAQA